MGNNNFRISDMKLSKKPEKYRIVRKQKVKTNKKKWFIICNKICIKLFKNHQI